MDVTEAFNAVRECVIRSLAAYRMKRCWSSTGGGEDSSGRMWVGTWGGGLAVYDASNPYDAGRWTVFGVEDAQGGIWVATGSWMRD